LLDSAARPLPNAKSPVKRGTNAEETVMTYDPLFFRVGKLQPANIHRFRVKGRALLFRA